MPTHDWTMVDAGTFHNFHYRWIAALMDRLNGGLLPRGFFAMAEQVIGGPETDVLTLQSRTATALDTGAVAVAPPRPKAIFVFPAGPEKEAYARKARRIAIHHGLGHAVAVIEIVSPGNKDSRHALRAFVEQAANLIRQGVHVLVVDLFPPTRRDPQGIHKAIWDEITDQPFDFQPSRPLIAASYQAAPTRTAYVEPFAVGEQLPGMPLFLHDEYDVTVPLDETYQTTWNLLPVELQQLLEPSQQS